MNPLELDPEPAEVFDRLHHTDPATARRVDAWFDRIEADPGASAVRRRLIRPGRAWMIVVQRADPTNTDDLAILWDLDGATPVVRYLGPATFT
ncbi:hypothetical protein [Blastococcus sp. SYSU DS0619]